MEREDVLKVVVVGDCYHVRIKSDPEVFNFYVSRIEKYYLVQDTSDGEIPYRLISYPSIESIEAY